jgi:flagellar FliL protein
MKALLFPIILAVFAAGGVIAADTVRGDAPAPAADGSHGTDSADHGGDDSHGEGDSGDHADEEGADDTDFINFKRQFVVPVLKDNAVEALILINLGLEVPAAERDNMFRLEPRFRDAFIRELLQLSDDGYFDQELTSPDTYEVLRETLSRAANDISDGGIKDILILDLSRQDR